MRHSYRLADLFPFSVTNLSSKGESNVDPLSPTSSSNFILCSDSTGGNGQFAFHYLLFKLLNITALNDRNPSSSSGLSSVVIISANHDEAHYFSLLRKQVRIYKN